MKAVFIEEFGAPEVMKYGDWPDPVAGPGEILVDVHAASVNPADAKVRSATGNYDPKDLQLPMILGRDFSGTVRALGDGVTDFQVGDAVFAVLDRGVEAAYAEQVVIPAKLAAKKPADWSHVEAAALALTGLTALVSIEDTIKLRADEKILIQGGAGGVGSFAVQLCHYIGAHVVATASPRNHDYLHDFGADEIIDYNTVDFATAVSDCDAVFDTVGYDVQLRSYEVLKPGGRLAWISPAPKGSTPPRDDVTVVRPQVARDREHLERVIELVGLGVIKPPAIETMPLSEVVEAHRKIETGHVRGKIVLTIR